jgi:hypothetical protein
MSRRQRHLTLRPLPGAALQLDSRVLTGAVGSTVQTWPDRSGMGRNPTQSNSAARASVVIGESGQRCLSFDGARFYQIPSSTALFNGLHNGSPSLVFTAARPATPAAPAPEAAYVMWGNNRTSSAQVGVTVFWDNRASASASNTLRGSIARGVNQFFAAVVAANNFWPGNSWRINRTAFDADAAAADRLMFRNSGADAVGGNTATDPPTTSNASFDMFIGSAAADIPTIQFVGLMGSIIMFTNHSLSSSMQRRIDHALAAAFKITCA